MKTRDNGLTLIELMIVVAIIGVLAAMAAPVYRNYVAKAQVMEAFNITAAIRRAHEEFFHFNGRWAISTVDAGGDLPVENQVPGYNPWETNYVAMIFPAAFPTIDGK